MKLGMRMDHSFFTVFSLAKKLKTAKKYIIKTMDCCKEEIFYNYIRYNCKLTAKEDFKLALKTHPNPVSFFLNSRLIEDAICQLKYDVIQDLAFFGTIDNYTDEHNYNLIGILLSCNFFSSIYEQTAVKFIKMYNLLTYLGVDDFNIDGKGKSVVDFIDLLFFDRKSTRLSNCMNGILANFFYERYKREFQRRNIRL